MDLFERLLALPRRPRITFEVDDDSDVPAGRWESKLGGAPYLPSGAGHPRHTAAGGEEPMAFLAQVNLAHLEAWRIATGAPAVLDGHLPTAGMLQFFIPHGEGWGYERDSPDRFHTCLVQYWAEVIEDDAALADPLVVCLEETSWAAALLPETDQPVRGPRGHVLSANGGGEQTPLRQPRFPFRLSPTRTQPEHQLPDAWNSDVPEDLAVAVGEYNRAHRLDTELSDFIGRESGSGGIQIGGYPEFTQDDPRPRGSDMVLLFQLDSTTGALSIGDSGVMNFFIPRDDLASGNLRNVRMHWDCC